MSDYQAPIAEMRLLLDMLHDPALPGAEEAGPELVEAVLTEAARFAGEVLAPLNPVGDREGSRLENGVVVTPPGWKDAYDAFVAGGWNGLTFDPEWGGQGLPSLLGAAVGEMWHAANMAFGLCPMLTQGAAEAILHHGSEVQKQLYLPKLVSGEWTGTMCLTEPQAGSDLSAVRTRAVPEGDHYRITGQKIFITYGDHELAPNILHLVLARLPDAPPGVKGISLFAVPKYLPDAAGAPGARNDVRCVSLEHKLGIHGSPTAVLAFGDAGGAVGTLVGEANRGLNHMFTMMNAARLSVGLEGLGIAERACQQALAYAAERRQGRAVGDASPAAAPIARHPDVRRMLLGMQARIGAMRALAYACAAAADGAHRHPDAGTRARHQARVDLLTPVVKGWCTETGVRIASTALQVHGGMGYVEETGAAQHYRDARITPIYEGTTGIQAADLVGRKVLRDGGEAIGALLAEMRDLLPRLAAREEAPFPALRDSLEKGIGALEQAVTWLIEAERRDPRLPLAASGPFLELAGVVIGGHGLFRAALHAAETMTGGEAGFRAERLRSARFYAGNILPEAAGWLAAATTGAEATLDPAEAEG
ncbi:acyl-CoA dehydrogenase [Roseomonas sp. OT10]|uniref:acyl-CoA dehydrogenase n=1 Tax=Roseomonas cutis TaxID=2897332 RepID=UPI001E6421ED|nr:acyl-CoA dehydrogenase [Roseomonas sp. OT10]UFN49481.1 acyl-CoA dehydrogenase [Roseomonas sp. OT10]